MWAFLGAFVARLATWVAGLFYGKSKKEQEIKEEALARAKEANKLDAKVERLSGNAVVDGLQRFWERQSKD